LPDLLPDLGRLQHIDFIQLPDLPDQFCGRVAKDAVAAPPISCLSPKEEEVSLFQGKSGRSGSHREWLVSGRARGRAMVGQDVGQPPTRDLARHLHWTPPTARNHHVGQAEEAGNRATLPATTTTIPWQCEGALTLAASRGDVWLENQNSPRPTRRHEPPTCCTRSGTYVIESTSILREVEFSSIRYRNGAFCQCVQNESAHGVIRLPAHPRVDLRSLRSERNAVFASAARLVQSEGGVKCRLG
jgi:hypothetical protein